VILQGTETGVSEEAILVGFHEGDIFRAKEVKRVGESKEQPPHSRLGLRG